MNNIDKSIPVEPQIEVDGWYAYCPICLCIDLIPEKDVSCPMCNQILDWNWYTKIANNK